MNRNSTFFLTILLFTIFSTHSFATKFYSNSNGNWSDGNSWNNGGDIPTENDSVYINGHVITVDSKIKIRRIEFTNTALTFSGSSLIVDGTDTLTVTEDVLMTSENKFKNADISVIGTATFIVNGNLSMIRVANNNSSSWLALFLSGDSKTYILGDLSYDYGNSGNIEFANEIYTFGNALLDVAGKTNLSISDGKELQLRAEGNSKIILQDSVSLLTYGGGSSRITSTSNSSIDLNSNVYMLNSGGSSATRIRSGTTGGNLNIFGNLFMESTLDKSEVIYEVDGSLSSGSVSGNISMTAVADSSVYITLENEGALKFGGELLRPNGYGALKMHDDAQLILNGTVAQTIPNSQLLDAANKDSLYFSTLIFENTSGEAISLQGDFIVQDTLFLTSGNIITSASSLLIIEEDAFISGGNELAYIEGPVLKKGSINETTFTFPIGDEDAYAPMTISNKDFASSQFTAQYYSDPPPFGVINLNGGLINVSQGEYWTLDKSSGSQDVDITLHWENAQISGITDIASLAIAGYDQVNNEWDNFGNGGTTGTTGSNGSGTIINSLASDPPPFGVIHYTLGSISAMNSLPVDLTSFQAFQQNTDAYLYWETASERNTSHFSIERSSNEFDFKEIGRVTTDGNAVINRQYSFKDILPQTGINYYRLKIVDHDGSFEYSNIEVVHFEEAPTNQIFPNPVEKTIQINGFDTELEDVQIEIFNQNGQLIYSNLFSTKNGQVRISTDIAKVHEAGTYFVRIIGSRKNRVLKFIKIH